MLRFLSSIGFLVIGVLLGGFFFSDTQPRSLLAVHRCEHCLSHSELLGLIGSVIVQKTPALRPVILETEKSVVIEHPLKKTPVHYVVIPKKDIRSASDLAEGDEDYLVDAYAVMQSLIEQENLEKYRIFTNGPGFQQVNYLHFHLQGIRGEP